MPHGMPPQTCRALPVVHPTPQQTEMGTWPGHGKRTETAYTGMSNIRCHHQNTSTCTQPPRTPVRCHVSVWDPTACAKHQLWRRVPKAHPPRGGRQAVMRSAPGWQRGSRPPCENWGGRRPAHSRCHGAHLMPPCTPACLAYGCVDGYSARAHAEGRRALSRRCKSGPDKHPVWGIICTWAAPT